MSVQYLRKELFDTEDLIYQKYQTLNTDLQNNKLSNFVFKNTFLDTFNDPEQLENIRIEIANFMINYEQKNKILKNFENQNINIILKSKFRQLIYKGLECSILNFIVNKNLMSFNYIIDCENCEYFNTLKENLNNYDEYQNLLNNSEKLNTDDFKNILKEYFETKSKRNLKDFILDSEKYEKSLNVEIFYSQKLSEDHEKDCFLKFAFVIHVSKK